MASLKDFFDTDFPNVANVGHTFHVGRGSEIVEVQVRVHLDFDSYTKYLSAFVPVAVNPARTISGILNNLDKLLAIADVVEVQTNFVGEAPAASTDLVFAGRIFIYSEGEIDKDHLQLFLSEARRLGHHLHFRGPEYAKERSALERPIAFISHDSRDKDAVARPIALGLTRLMCPVWFDEFTLKVGDRLRESIERGIRECKKCVLVLSPNFLSNPGWTKAEFNSIFTRELIENTDILLPVWWGVSKQEIFEYSPTLVDRLGVSWDLGEEEVVRRLYRAINA